MMAVPPKYDVPHLWIVIASPTPADQTVLAVNVTSDEIRAGREYVFSGGEHGRVTHESYVSFSDALIIPVASLKRLTGVLVTPEKPMSPAIVSKIIEIAKTSKSVEECKKSRL